MRKKVLLGLLSLILVLGIAAAGCTEEAAAPETTTTPPATALEEPAAEPIELSIAIHTPPQNYFCVGLEEWAAKMLESTDGMVNITVYPSEALGKMSDEWTMVRTGVCDMTWLIPIYSPGAAPLWELFSMPGVGVTYRDLETTHVIFDKYLYQEVEDTKMLWLNQSGANLLYTIDKPVESLEDLKGLQIRAGGGAFEAWFKAADVTPVMIPAPEVYSALERGMIDGCLFPPEAGVSLKVSDIAKYYTDVNSTCSPSLVVMNMDVWNGLPPDAQKAFDELNPWIEQRLNDLANEDDVAAFKSFEQSGMVSLSLPPEDLKKWNDAYWPFVESTVEDMEAKGLPGGSLVEEVRQLSSK